MAKQKSIGRRVASVISFLLILAALAAVIAVIYRFTNGFNEDFKTFYLECEGEQVLTTNTKRSFLRGETYRYDVKYTFDFGDTEPRDYSVKVVSHSSEDTAFKYQVDGKTLTYQSDIDLTSAFDIKIYDTYFTITFPDDMTLQTVFDRVYQGKTVEMPAEENGPGRYQFTLAVSSYNQSVVYRIDFCFYVPVAGIEPSAKELYF